jgi:hypothetical protein
VIPVAEATPTAASPQAVGGGVKTPLALPKGGSGGSGGEREGDPRVSPTHSLQPTGAKIAVAKAAAEEAVTE